MHFSNLGKYTKPRLGRMMPSDPGIAHCGVRPDMSEPHFGRWLRWV
jgi:hypothetical protein